jgi:hypothetical protein
MSQTDRSNRTRRIIQSSPRVIAHVVPQGSLVWPLLFFVYIYDVPLNIHIAKLVLYADDTNILVTGNDEEALQDNLSSVMKQMKVWFLNNDLIVNTTKTIAMSFHLCQSKPPYTPSILLQNTEIAYMSEVKFFRNIYHGKSKLARSYSFSVSEFEQNLLYHKIFKEHS